MNLFKTILAGSIALACVDSAFADVTIRITGSTAYRGQTHKAIINILNGGAVNAAFKGANLNGASKATFIGTISGQPALGTVTIKTSWSGSVGGVQTVSNSLNVPFIPDVPSSTAVATAGAGNATGGAVVADADVTEIPQVAMSDTYQNSTPFKANTLVESKVGVVPFKWVASKGAPTGLTNVTPQLAQALFSNGTLPLALFTGSSADEGTLVYATGRDPDSGTRLTAFAETGVGVNSVVIQYLIGASGGNVTGYTPYAEQIINGITVPEGQGGEASGGTLAGLIGNNAATAGTGFSITYLSVGDATTAITGGAKELTYNGSLYSVNAVASGQYTFWGYEHLMYRSSLAGDSKTVADLLRDRLKNFDAAAPLLGAMRSSRPTDGGLVTNNY